MRLHRKAVKPFASPELVQSFTLSIEALETVEKQRSHMGLAMPKILPGETDK